MGLLCLRVILGKVHAARTPRGQMDSPLRSGDPRPTARISGCGETGPPAHSVAQGSGFAETALPSALPRTRLLWMEQQLCVLRADQLPGFGSHRWCGAAGRARGARIAHEVNRCYLHCNKRFEEGILGALAGRPRAPPRRPSGCVGPEMRHVSGAGGVEAETGRACILQAGDTKDVQTAGAKPRGVTGSDTCLGRWRCGAADADADADGRGDLRLGRGCHCSELAPATETRERFWAEQRPS